MNQKKMSTERTEGNKFSRSKIVFCVIYAAILLEAVLMGKIQGLDFTQNLVNVVTAVICIILLQSFYEHEIFRCTKSRNKENIYSNVLYAFNIILSILLIIINEYLFIGCLWLVSVAVISAIDGMKHGTVCYILCIVQYLLYSGEYAGDKNILLYYVIIGAAMVLMFADNTMRELVFSGLSLPVFSAVFIMVRYGFDMRKISAGKAYAIIQILSAVVVVLITLIVRHTIEQLENAGVCTVYGIKNKETVIPKEILNEDCELMSELKSFSERLYIHSVAVGRMSEGVAKKMGYDSALAKAGGMYHEIGRIKKDEFEDFVKMTAEKYDFCNALTGLIIQNYRKKPENKETAVVMLSDSIVSMVDYFEKNTDKTMPAKEKIIEGIFLNRLKKGNLSECDISDDELKKLKKIYENIM